MRHESFRLLVVLSIVGSTSAVLAVDSLDKGRLPVPATEAQQQALVTVKELFRVDYTRARAPSEFGALADKLIAQLGEGPGSAANNYVLLKEALSLSVRASDVRRALEVAIQLSKRYDVDARQLKLDTLRQFQKGVPGVDRQLLLVKACHEAAVELLDDDQFETAVEFAELAETVARKLPVADQRKQANNRVVEVRDIQKLAQAALRADKKLASNPSDPAANDALGRFLITAKGDWTTGLSRLAQGGDAELQAAAKQDRTAAQAVSLTPDEAVAIADCWWDLAPKLASPALQSAVRRRAAAWYAWAMPQLTGLTATKASRRITEVGGDLTTVPPPTACAFASSIPIRTLADVSQAIEAAAGLMTGDFAVCQTMPLETCHRVTHILARSGFRPIRIRPFTTPAGEQVAAIWHRDGREFRIHYGSREVITDKDTEFIKSGFLPVDAAGYLDTVEQYVAVWARLPPTPDLEIVLDVGMDRPEFDARFEIHKKTRMPLTCQYFLAADGKRRYTCLWRSPSLGSCQVRVGDVKVYEEVMKPERMQQTDAVVVGTGMANEAPGPRFGGIWRVSTNLKSVELHGLTPEGQLAEWKKLADQGYHPAAIGVGWTKDNKWATASVWHPKSP
jgi:hypothetical protein